MELAPPTIAEAFGRCVERGATLVVVAPFFLSPGRHWQEDIPALADEAARAPRGEICNIGAHRVTSAHVGGDRFAREALHGARVRGRAGVRRLRGIEVWM